MESMTLRAAESVAQTIRAIGEGPNRLLIWPDVRPPGITPEIIEEAWSVLLGGRPYKGLTPAYPWLMSQEDTKVLYPNGFDAKPREFENDIVDDVLDWLAENKRSAIPHKTFLQVTEQAVSKARLQAAERETLGANLIYDPIEGEGSLITIFRQLESAGVIAEGTIDRAMPLLRDRPGLVWRTLGAVFKSIDNHVEILADGGEILTVDLVYKLPPREPLGDLFSAVGLEKTNCGQPDCPFHGHLNQGDEDHDGADEDPEGVDDDLNQPDDDPNGTSL